MLDLDPIKLAFCVTLDILAMKMGINDANEDDDSNRNDEICTAHRKALKYGALSPFDDSDDSSKLSAVQTLYFYINYLFDNLLI